MRKSGVYVIENLVNGKCYVGSSQDIHRRWQKHVSGLNLQKHPNLLLRRAWNKYGETNFKFWIAEECFSHECFAREQWWMDSLKPFYNYCKLAAGFTGADLSLESREAIRKKLSGRKLSPEHKARISRGLNLRPKKYCSVANCGLPLESLGLCSLHYQRQRRGVSLDNPRGYIKGELVSNHKLNTDIVKEILLSELSGRALARKFNVSRTLIKFVRQRKLWRHVNV